MYQITAGLVVVYSDNPDQFSHQHKKLLKYTSKIINFEFYALNLTVYCSQHTINTTSVWGNQNLL